VRHARQIKVAHELRAAGRETPEIGPRHRAPDIRIRPRLWWAVRVHAAVSGISEIFSSPRVVLYGAIIAGPGGHWVLNWVLLVTRLPIGAGSTKRHVVAFASHDGGLHRAVPSQQYPTPAGAEWLLKSSSMASGLSPGKLASG
jgi:hypothetical protein